MALYFFHACPSDITTSSVNGNSDESEAIAEADYVSISQRVVFGAGDTRETVTLTITDDDIQEITEYLKVGLSDADCSIGNNNSIIIQILDNDGKFC